MRGLRVLLFLAALVPAAHAGWPVGPCWVDYAENPSPRTQFAFIVERPAPKSDLGIYLKYGTPQRCWEQAFRRWAYFVEWCQGVPNRNGSGPTFPYDGCGKWVN